jgi:hypothetical protein
MTSMRGKRDAHQKPEKTEHPVRSSAQRSFGSGRLGPNKDSNEHIGRAPVQIADQQAGNSSAKTENAANRVAKDRAKQAPKENPKKAVPKVVDMPAAKTEIKRAVQLLSMDGAKFGKAHLLLVRYIENILSHPTALKYRQIRTTNEKFKVVWKEEPSKVLMLAVGFVEHGDMLELDPLTDCHRDLLRSALGQLKSMKDYTFWVD